MSNKIGPLNLKKQYSSIKKEVLKAVETVLENQEFIGGKEVEKIENSISKLCGTKLSIGVNSGTDALFLSLKALGIKAGDEVITTPFTFIATAEVITAVGAKPVFVDIDEKTFNINSELIEEAITKDTKAIIPVHLFGRMAEMERIIAIAKKHKLFVIEDAAQAIGSQYNKRKAGAIGDVGCFSFFPSKNLGGIGDGGAITTNNKKVADRLKVLRNHGSSAKEKYLNLELGVNSRLDSINAATLNVKIKYLKKWNSERREVAKYYNEGLKDIKEIITPEIGKGDIFNQYTIKAVKRDKLAAFLIKNGIEAKIYYPMPLHLQPALRFLGYKAGDFPVAEKLAKSVLSLPIYPELDRGEADFVISIIKKFFNSKR